MSATVISLAAERATLLEQGRQERELADRLEATLRLSRIRAAASMFITAALNDLNAEPVKRREVIKQYEQDLEFLERWSRSVTALDVKNKEGK